MGTAQKVMVKEAGFAKKEDAYACFVIIFAENFPEPDACRSETELRAWGEYWEEVEALRRITHCSEMVPLDAFVFAS
mgnify:CR=1 FL=1